MGVYRRPPRSDELYHFGVLGMKWGIRRYQNPDGSLTQAGKKRYLKTMHKDADSYYKSHLTNKHAKKRSGMDVNLHVSRGERWGQGRRKGLLSDADEREVRDAEKSTRAYIYKKYGRSAMKALSGSNVLFKPIDDFSVNTTKEGKALYDDITQKRHIAKYGRYEMLHQGSTEQTIRKALNAGYKMDKDDPDKNSYVFVDPNTGDRFYLSKGKRRR